MIILCYIGIVNSKSDMGRHNQLPTKIIGNLIFKFKGTKKKKKHNEQKQLTKYYE